MTLPVSSAPLLVTDATRPLPQSEDDQPRRNQAIPFAFSVICFVVCLDVTLVRVLPHVTHSVESTLMIVLWFVFLWAATCYNFIMVTSENGKCPPPATGSTARVSFLICGSMSLGVCLFVFVCV